MNPQIMEKMPEFLATLGLDQEPMGLFYTDEKPNGCLSPKTIDLPTRRREERNEIDWQAVFGDFSCIMGHIWRARRKKKAACFSAQHFGCAGGAFWMGFNKPQTDTIINYVSTGIPGWTTGERYCMSPDKLRQVFDRVDPVSAPKPYCVIKPLSLFDEDQTPDLVIFFSRPESLCGLHQLAFFVTGDPDVVVSPWSAACGSIAAWPLGYLERGENRAVIGGWDPSARKYFRADELSFTMPFQMLTQMVELYRDSFLGTREWSVVKKKISRSNKVWDGPSRP